jgi:hypothetical protein
VKPLSRSIFHEVALENCVESKLDRSGDENTRLRVVVSRTGEPRRDRFAPMLAPMLFDVPSLTHDFSVAMH